MQEIFGLDCCKCEGCENSEVRSVKMKY